MLYLTDTCFWKHAHLLFEDTSVDIRALLNRYRWGYSLEIKKELLHYRLTNFLSQDEAHLIPISTKDWQIFNSKYPYLQDFDKPDQSLILIALRDQNVILTDDGSLFIEAKALHISSFLLPLFLINQVKFGYCSKKKLNQCLRFWEIHGLYAKRDIKNWSSTLKLI